MDVFGDESPGSLYSLIHILPPNFGLVRSSKLFLCNFFFFHPIPLLINILLRSYREKLKVNEALQDSGLRKKRTINFNLVCFQIYFTLFLPTAFFFGGYQVVEQRYFLDKRLSSFFFFFFFNSRFLQ
jgi:hypothetical protein